MGFENLSQEQKERAEACKTPEELKALADEEGFLLTDEELKGLDGGSFCRVYIKCPNVCPKAVDLSGRPCAAYIFV